MDRLSRARQAWSPGPQPRNARTIIREALSLLTPYIPAAALADFTRVACVLSGGAVMRVAWDPYPRPCCRSLSIFSIG